MGRRFRFCFLSYLVVRFTVQAEVSKPVRAFAWGFCSLREAVAGMSPRRATFFLWRSKERRQRKATPTGAVRLGPDCSAVLVLWVPRQTRFAACGRCAQTNVAKSDDEACCARGPKPLRSSTPPTGPKSDTVVCCANFPVHVSLRLGAQRDAHLAMRSEPSGGVRSNRCAVLRICLQVKSRGRKQPKRYSKVESVFALVTFF